MARIVGETRRSTVAGETVAAFVPLPLPPSDPPVAVESLGEVLPRAQHALSRLDLAGEMVPSLDWFIYAFVRKEAVVSSQIEGTEATLDDLLTFEATPEGTKPGADVEEVCNYLDALSWARRELARPKGLPLSMRLVHGVHRRLMKGVRGASKQPGEVRRSQNWVGGTRASNAAYVPPPPEEVPRLLGDLERYIHAVDSLPPLVRAGLVHVQFESIHPYLDGNGRVGRLLIALLLEHWKLLSAPLLYLSLHFKRRRPDYYRLLNEGRRTGDWEGWTVFFLAPRRRPAQGLRAHARTADAVLDRAAHDLPDAARPRRRDRRPRAAFCGRDSTRPDSCTREPLTWRTERCGAPFRSC